MYKTIKYGSGRTSLELYEAKASSITPPGTKPANQRKKNDHNRAVSSLKRQRAKMGLRPLARRTNHDYIF